MITEPLSVLKEWGPRWSDAVFLAAEMVGATGVVRKWGEADYQGSAAIVLYKESTDAFARFEWSWGSCSGCDQWDAADYSDYNKPDSGKTLADLARNEFISQIRWMPRADFLEMLRKDIKAKADWCIPNWCDDERVEERLTSLIKDIES